MSFESASFRWRTLRDMHRASVTNRTARRRAVASLAAWRRKDRAASAPATGTPEQGWAALRHVWIKRDGPRYNIGRRGGDCVQTYPWYTLLPRHQRRTA